MLESIALLLLQQRAAPSPANLDSDGDGLSDYQELHKYFTDPHKADTDGDGIPDGDWDERREYAYTVRVVMQLMPPCDPATMNDDYQDVRVLDQRPDAVEFEAVLYPFNTNAEALAGLKDERPGPALRPYVEPGITSNWDESLRAQLVAELAQQGIDTAKLPALELAPKAAKWMMQRSKFEDSFTTFDVVLEDGRLAVDPQLKDTVERELAKSGRTLAEQWQRELFGRGMFENRLHGSCTSSAIYLQTGLRALGIPTRTVVCTPALDANDEREVAWIDARIAHNEVRRILKRAAKSQKGSWTSHTFNEVWIGGRWRRLNYDKLGQNILDANALGLMVHVNTYRDHAEAGLASWGLHSAFTPKSGLFAGPNPYSCISLSDRFGAHCKLGNPPLEEFKALTIASSYWFGDESVPGSVKMKLADGEEQAGHLIVRVAEVREGEGTEQYADFYDHVGKEFVLRGRDGTELHAKAARGYWLDSNHGVRDFYIRIPPADFARMKPGAAFELAPPAAKDGYAWSVKPGLEIAR